MQHTSVEPNLLFEFDIYLERAKTGEKVSEELKVSATCEKDKEGLEQKQRELENQGWEVWLKTIFPFAFSKDFAPFHREFWDLWWEVVISIRDKKPIAPEKLTILYLLGRALGKSSTGTPSSLMKGAILGHIYSLYISEVFDQACEHLDNVRFLMYHPDSKLLEYYPHLAIDAQGAKKAGLKGKDAEGIFITVGGCVFRAFGLDSSARGIGLFGKRPDDYNIDDVDNLNHSIAVSMGVIKKITRNFLMTQDLIGDIPVTTKVLQNLIIPHGFVNQVFTNKTDALSERTVIGVVNTFKHLDIKSDIDESGKIRHTILPTSIPSWEAVTIEVAQRILNLLGLEGFMAECQNSFDLSREELVFPTFSEELHVITWSDFERVFGVREIPFRWERGVGHDLGFTREHASAWSFIAKSAMNTKLPNTYFLYRGLSFVQIMSDDQADFVNKIFSETHEKEAIQVWRMSHERLNERMTYNSKHGFNFSACNKSKEAGISEGNHLFRPDRTKPHPFYEDELLDSGFYKLGCPSFFWIVADDQKAVPRDDAGLYLHRHEISNYRRVPIKVTEQGLTEEKPAKIFDNAMDSLKMILDQYTLIASPRTKEEEIELRIPETLKAEEVSQHYGQEGFGELVAARIREQKNISEEIDNEAKQLQENLDRRFSRKSGLGLLGRRRR